MAAEGVSLFESGWERAKTMVCPLSQPAITWTLAFSECILRAITMPVLKVFEAGMLLRRLSDGRL